MLKGSAAARGILAYCACAHLHCMLFSTCACSVESHNMVRQSRTSKRCALLYMYTYKYVCECDNTQTLLSRLLGSQCCVTVCIRSRCLFQVSCDHLICPCDNASINRYQDTKDYAFEFLACTSAVSVPKFT